MHVAHLINAPDGSKVVKVKDTAHTQPMAFPHLPSVLPCLLHTHNTGHAGTQQALGHYIQG